MSGRLTWPTGYQQPRLPSLPARWTGSSDIDIPTPELSEREDQTDEFGLSVSVFGELPNGLRASLSRALDFFRGSKLVGPQAQGLGTVPELVMVGMCLEAGMRYNLPAGWGFAFQTQLLGGRIPGGAVADVVLYIGPRVHAVRVQSFFHTGASPFGGGAKEQEDERQRNRLLRLEGIQAVVDVNRAIDGFPLEHGPDVLARRDFQRAVRGDLR